MRRHLHAIAVTIVLVLTITGGLSASMRFVNAPSVTAQGTSTVSVDHLALPDDTLATPGASVQPWLQLVLEIRLPEDAAVDHHLLWAVQTAVERRAHVLGVSDPIIETRGENQIIVEVPLVTEPDRMMRVLSDVGLLEFIDPHREALPVGTVVRTSLGPPWLQAPDGPLYETIVSGGDFRDFLPISENPGEESVISFTLTTDAAFSLYEFTSSHVGEPMSIVIDKQVISTPIITGVIAADGLIEGISPDLFEDLLLELKSGPIPAPLEVVQSRTVERP